MPPSNYDAQTLLELYKIAVEEYRFEVRLGWDRMKYFLVFNSAVVSLGTGLLKINTPGPIDVDVLVGLVFVVGFFTSIIGIYAVRKGHHYYRRTIFKKTLIEDLMGLWDPIEGYPSGEVNLAVATTKGQGDRDEILRQPDQWLNRRLRTGNVVFLMQCILGLIALFDLFGGVFAFTRSG